MPSSLKIPYPPAFTNALNSLKLLNFDFVKFTPVECVKRVNFVESLYVTTILPIFAFGVVLICYLIHVHVINNCSCMLKFCEDRKKNYWETVEVDCYEPVKDGNDFLRNEDGTLQLQPSVKLGKNGKPVVKKVEGVAEDEKFRRTFVINPLWPSYLYGILYLSGIILPGITCKIFQMFVCYNLGYSTLCLMLCPMLLTFEFSLYLSKTNSTCTSTAITDPLHESNLKYSMVLKADSTIYCNSPTYYEGLRYFNR